MKTAREIMSNNPVCCTLEMSLADAAELMLKYDCGEIPVVYSMRDKKVLGVITDRDICVRAVAVGLNPLSMNVEQCMSYPPIVVKEGTSVDDCCKLMEEHQIRRIPVIDENENCCGIISLADIVKIHNDDLLGSIYKKVAEPPLVFR